MQELLGMSETRRSVRARLAVAGVPLMVGLQLLQEQAKSKAFKNERATKVPVELCSEGVLAFCP